MLGAAPEARLLATEAALRSGVRIEQVRDMAMLQVVCDVVDEIWRPPAGQTTVRIDFLRALTHAGNYCVLAWDGTRPVGVCFGFLSVEPARELHSHIAGVVPSTGGRHVGRALKLDQRAWALEHGLSSIGWTFDPLIRRNAFFNAAKLGALPTRYLVDFYGVMNDSINTGQATDRVKVSWPLLGARTSAVLAGREVTRPVPDLLAAGAGIVLDVVDDAPSARPSSAPVRLVRVPADIETLRVADPALGTAWRTAVRDSLGGLMDEGWTVTDFGRDGYYVLERALGNEGGTP
ncbi:hypothetical protein GCM10027265_12580 [Jatrophihabitans fulvus]